jgi:hypothetical protein
LGRLREGMIRVTPLPEKTIGKKKDTNSAASKYKRCETCNDLMVKLAQPDKVCRKCKRNNDGYKKDN